MKVRAVHPSGAIFASPPMNIAVKSTGKRKQRTQDKRKDGGLFSGKLLKTHAVINAPIVHQRNFVECFPAKRRTIQSKQWEELSD